MELKGLEVQAQDTAVAADRIGASSSIATTGVAELTAATSGLTTSQNLATLSTEQLDAMVAGEAVAMGTAAAATEAAAVSAGAYGSVLFTTAEAEVAATVAAGGFTAALSTAAATITGLVATIAPWLIALGIAIKYLEEYIEAEGKAALAAETAAAKQDTINKAISEGAPKTISYGDAVKYVNAQFQHWLAMQPDVAAQKYIDKLIEQGKAAMNAGAEQAALTEGLAKQGIVIGETIDVQKLMTDARKKDEDATKKAREAQERWDKSIQDATIHMRLSVFTLHAFGAVELPQVESSLKGVAEEATSLAATVLPQLGISIYDIGQKGVKSFGDLRTTAQRFDQEMVKIARDLPMMFADALRSGDWTRGLDQIGSEIGTRLGMAIGGPLGAAIGSLLPEIGQTIANFFGKLFHTSFGEDLVKEVEDAVQRAKDIVNGKSTATDEVGNATHAAGAKTIEELQHAADVARKAYEEAFASGKYNQENLDKLYIAFQQAMADAGSEAAKAWLKAHDAAISGASTIDAALKKLIDRRDELTKGISQEAPEAEMGVIEQQMRAERDALDEQIKNAQTAADAAADAQGGAAKQTEKYWGDTSIVLRDDMSTAADDAASHIKDAFNFTIHIPIIFDNPGIPVVPMASGGSGTVREPTLFLAGEAGPEQYSFSGANRGFSGEMSTGPIVVQVMLDGQLVAENTVTRMARDKRGIGTKARRALGVA